MSIHNVIIAPIEDIKFEQERVQVLTFHTMEIQQRRMWYVLHLVCMCGPENLDQAFEGIHSDA